MVVRCPFRCGLAVRLFYKAMRFRRMAEEAQSAAVRTDLLDAAEHMIREARLLDERTLEVRWRRRRQARSTITVYVPPR